MKNMYGLKSIAFNTFILLLLVVAAQLIIGHRYVWLLFVLIVFIENARLQATRFQIITLSTDVILFKSLNPFRKNVVIDVATIDDIVIVGANVFSYLIVLSTGNNHQTFRINMHSSEFRKLFRELSLLGLHIDVKGSAANFTSR